MGERVPTGVNRTAPFGFGAGACSIRLNFMEVIAMSMSKLFFASLAITVASVATLVPGANAG